MTSSTGASRQRPHEDGGILEGSWVWIALPVGILVLIAALWFLVIGPAGSPPPRMTATPASTPTAWPTITPMAIIEPTQPPAQEVVPTVAAPGGIGVGAKVVVFGTGATELRIRQSPGTDTVTIKVVPDGTQLTIVGGPEVASGFTWWKVDDGAGTVGWTAAQFLQLP